MNLYCKDKTGELRCVETSKKSCLEMVNDLAYAKSSLKQAGITLASPVFAVIK